MTTPAPQDFNPYQSPVPVYGPAGAPLALPPELKILKRFRREMQGLGGVWIFLGSIGVLCQLGAEARYRGILERWQPGFAA